MATSDEISNIVLCDYSAPIWIDASFNYTLFRRDRPICLVSDLVFEQNSAIDKETSHKSFIVVKQKIVVSIEEQAGYIKFYVTNFVIYIFDRIFHGLRNGLTSLYCSVLLFYSSYAHSVSPVK